MLTPEMTRIADMESAPTPARRPAVAWFMVAVLIWLVATVRPFGVSTPTSLDSLSTQTADRIADSFPVDTHEASAADIKADADEDLDAPASPRLRSPASPLSRDLARTAPRPHDPFVPLRPPILV